MQERAVTKLLVANRGEIAVRVIRGAQRLGLAAVAVYSDADAHALHVQAADAAVRIGPPPAGESYLDQQAIIEAARASGADAIHPGYGFLAENADFAAAVVDAGLVFVGPSSQAIALMGNKRAAKDRMQDAGVPCVPGARLAADQSAQEIAAVANQVGFPVMIKAAAGGGGRGMRQVEREDQLADAIASARSEAGSAFGNDELILEKCVTGARHVEIQVLADAHGHCIHLGERDCSIQRRHQKIVEESPCPVADSELRAAMGQAAVAAAQAIDYCGAGTVEFLLEPGGRFYFLEMNTRLQVEHPVTEMVTGFDLVEWQLRVAAGEPLGIVQEDVRLAGHAIEVRLCAEEPADNFLPQTGPVIAWHAPTGEGIRVDHGVRAPGEVSPYYDSMVAKVIAYGHDRDTARRRLLQALDSCLLFGVATNKDFLRLVLAHPAFAEGDFDTGFVPAHFPDPAQALGEPEAHQLALAAALLFHRNARHLAAGSRLPVELLHWHSANPTATPLVLRAGRGQEKTRLTVAALADGRCRVGCWQAEQEAQFEIAIEPPADADNPYRLRYRMDGQLGMALYAYAGDALWLDAAGRTGVYHDVTLAATETRGDAAGSGEIAATSDGKIMAVKVQAGDKVQRGDTLLVLEAMKMEFQIAADVDGSVEDVLVAAGDQVASRQLLVRIAPAEQKPEDESAA